MIKEQVICDSCGSNYIQCDGGSDPNGDGPCFNWTCNECGSQGVDYYTPKKTVKENYVIDTEPKIVKEDSFYSNLADKLRKSNYFIEAEPRMIKEDFSHPIAMVKPKPTGMEKLILLIRLPKGKTPEDATFITQSHYDDIIHYVAIGESENMEVEVINRPPNEMSILWGLFKWTYR